MNDRKELLQQLNECRVLNEKFETLHEVGLKPNTAFKEWVEEVEHDLNEGVVPEKIVEIIGHNINDLNLHYLSSTYYNWNRKEELERYENDRIGVLFKSKDYLNTYRLFRSVGFVDKNTVIVGANGSGKTTLANNLKKTLNSLDGIVIPAQKLLLVPTFAGSAVRIPTVAA